MSSAVSALRSSEGAAGANCGAAISVNAAIITRKKGPYSSLFSIASAGLNRTDSSSPVARYGRKGSREAELRMLLIVARSGQCLIFITRRMARWEK